MFNFVYFCQNCYNKNEILPRIFPLSFIAELNNYKCQTCGCNLFQMALTDDEITELQNVSHDPNFILSMNNLKRTNLVDFNLKLSQFKQTYLQQQQTVDTTPKCPTCGSSNIKKISATKRYVSTGLFGLGSSNIGKTRECNNCGYKW